MYTTLIQMSILMTGGVIWQILKPLGLSAEQTRAVLTSVVYYFFLPALVLDVLWKADIGIHSLQFTLIGISSIVFGLACFWMVGRLLKIKNQRFGALLLASAFPNVTYLGLPVLEQTFGSWTRSIVIQLDLFATAPFLYTFGIAIARYYGKSGVGQSSSWLAFLNAPPFWAAGLAVVLNINHVNSPNWLTETLKTLSAAVVPLMLFSLGLALNWKTISIKNLPYMVPVIVIKMIMLPIFSMTLLGVLTMEENVKSAVVMDMAMPSMVIGIVFCDRYQLDSSLYAMAVTITTALSLISLPFWYNHLMTGF